MTNTTRGLLVALLAGCAQPPETETCSTSQALTAEQGVMLNGAEINGRFINGLRVNGIRINGRQINGVMINGTAHNGRTPNGVYLNGRHLNGRYLNGESVNGRYLNGEWVNGRYLNGRYLNGRSYNSASLQGTNLQGTNLQGTNLQGTDLRGTLDGRPVGLEQLVGATLEGVTDDGETVPLTIVAVSRDPGDAELVYVSIESSDGENICGPQGRGLFVSGVWDESGARHDSKDQFTYSCTDGVIAKCVVWGYKPWRVGADLHQACTRMARADYCGDGVSHTRNGTTIDVFDAHGIQTPTTTAAEGFTFEAAWGPNGAICVSHPRYRDVAADGRARPPTCWSALPRCETFADAEAQGARIANASVETERRLACGL